MSGRRSASPDRHGKRSRPDHDRDRDRDEADSRHDRRDREKDRSSHKSDRKDRDRDHDRDLARKRSDRDESPPTSNPRTIASLAEVGVKELDVESDYFLKAAEFRIWLKEEKGKYFDELSGESARKWFKKFVKRWNNLTLPKQYYAPQSSTAAPSSSLTGYKWSFVNNRSRVDKNELSRIREDVDRLTHAGGQASSGDSGKVAMGPASGPSASTSRVMGPTLPSSMMFSASHTDRQLALEESQEAASASRKADRKRDYEKASEAAPKSGGREGKMDERRATNAENRQYRDRDSAAGMEIDDATLMGADGGFAAAKAKRDALDAKRQQNRAAWQNDKRAAAGDRFSEMKSKDQATMDMFRNMAAQRYGGA